MSFVTPTYSFRVLGITSLGAAVRAYQILFISPGLTVE